MTYDWNNNQHDPYKNLDDSYPNPFQGNQTDYRKRDNWNHKVLDDSQFRRSDIPTYHTLPGRDTHLLPFSHAMKRTNVNNNEKYNDIFGENRLYNSQNIGGYQVQQQPEYRQVQQPYEYRQQQLQTVNKEGVPRMKLLGDDIDTPQTNNTGDYERRKVYNAIIEYFPNFQLIKSGNFNGYGVYKAIVKCLLCTGVRYIVAIVKNDVYNVGTIRPLSVLKWESFQTRFADDDRDFKQFVYDSYSYEKPEETILDDPIRLVTRNKMSQIYNCDNLPLRVEILKTKEYEDVSDYGTVSSAIELFQTVLSFTR